MLAQPYECTTELYTLKWWFYGMWVISQFLKCQREEASWQKGIKYLREGILDHVRFLRWGESMRSKIQVEYLIELE